MRRYVVRDPQTRSTHHNTDMSDYLFSFDYDIELVNYITGCGNERWVMENHTIHNHKEEALQDLCNRCVKMEILIEDLREKVIAEIKEMEAA